MRFLDDLKYDRDTKFKDPMMVSEAGGSNVQGQPGLCSKNMSGDVYYIKNHGSFLFNIYELNRLIIFVKMEFFYTTLKT